MPVLEQVAEAIADGLPVAWSTHEKAALDDAERARLTELRLVSGIAGFHTTLHSSLRSSRPVDDRADRASPTEWGSLRVDALLGRGAHGDVYRAFDRRLDRAVALKLIRRDEPQGDERGAAVVEEGQLQAKVRHPGVVTIYGADRIDGRVGLWMELVEGGTLETELRRRGPLPSEEVARIGGELCESLGAVHEAGLLHRDVKTQNVMRDVDGHLVLGDFGTGQPLTDSAPALDAQPDGPIAGTPLYLAPELFEGRPATPQSDIYSLGVLLYHLATGSYPVGGRTVAELRAAHRAGRSVSLGEQRPDVPVHLEQAITHAVDPDARRRPTSVAELQDELAEGMTLAERLAQGPMSLSEALPLALQVAEVLEAVHARGVAHGHLTPSRVKVLEDGSVTLLGSGAGEGDAGDAAYLSPEQRGGELPDTPADVWAFGCLFYEMLTGSPAVGGQTSDAPTPPANPDHLPGELPPAGHRLLRRCLDRDSTQRLRDVPEALRLIAEELDPAKAMEAPASRPRLLPWVAAVLVVTAVAIGTAVWSLGGSPSVSGTDAFTVVLPPGVTLPSNQRIVAAISPDGRDLVYVGQRDGSSQLYRRPLASIDAVPMGDTEGAHSPFFSPDGAWVGFIVGDTLKKVALSGGASVRIATLPPVASFVVGAAWGGDDTIWLGNISTGLYRVPAGGGVATMVTTPGETTEGGYGHYAAQALPSQEALLLSVSLGDQARTSAALYPGRAALATYEPNVGELRILTEGARPWFSPTGHIVFSGVGAGNRLWAMPFDADRLEVTGERVQVMEGVRVTPNGTTLAYLGRDGTLVYVPASTSADDLRLVWVDQEGREEPLAGAPPRAYRAPRLSPDGTRLAVEVAEGDNVDIWIHDLERGTQFRLTRDPGPDLWPVFTPDSQRVVFTSDRGGTPLELFWMAADGSGPAVPLSTDPLAAGAASSWSKDGKSLLFSGIERGGSSPRNYDIGVVSLEQERSVQVLFARPYAELFPSVSPDGRRVAYASDESRPGQFEIYVSRFPDVENGRRLASTAGGYQAAWSGDGSALFYRVTTGAMMSVGFDPKLDLALARPQLLFEGKDYFAAITGRQWDVGADGRFLMIKGGGPEGPLREINVIRNWAATLEERVPVP